MDRSEQMEALLELVPDMGTLQKTEDELIACRDLPNGLHGCLMPMTFGKARLVVASQVDKHEIYDDGWCYESPVMAMMALAAWDGEGDPPVGWHRHIRTGRRRKDGDPDLEEQRW